MKDLAEALGKKKNIHLVASGEEAVIVLEVLSRDVREDSGTYTKVFGGKNEVKTLRARLRVGEFSAQLSGDSGVADSAAVLYAALGKRRHTN